jgi:diguanylate cyclase (GGDEF)-like protein/PAS domain S-box-containing protein
MASQEKKYLAEVLKTREALNVRFHAITLSAKDAIIMLNQEGIIVFWNQAATQIFGYSKTQMIGKSVYQTIIPPQQIEILKKEFRDLKNNGSDHFTGKILETTALRKDRIEFPIEMSISAVIINQKSEIIIIIRDISERKKNDAIIHHQAKYDALTDLPNRVLFYERLNFSLSNADRTKSWVSLLSIDIDSFKSVNDNYGHEIGDELLRQISRRFLDCTRQTDMMSRLGGDEFVMILTNIHHKQEIELVAEKILEQVAIPFNINNKTISITASIGIAIYPLDARDKNELISKADYAMYTAKKTGKNKFCFFKE